MTEKGFQNIHKALDTMGYTGLRDEQVEPLRSIFKGNDTYAVLATGGGKSALYALPVLTLGIRALVFSPLVSLMEDQVKSMNHRGIMAGTINSSQGLVGNDLALRKWCSGELSLLYVAPERIATADFRTAMNSVKPDMIVLDECHTMSNWVSTFRPDYVECGKVVQEIQPWVTLALTATSTKRIREDVISILKMDNPVVCNCYKRRDNLKMSSELINITEQDVAERNAIILKEVEEEVRKELEERDADDDDDDNFDSLVEKRFKARAETLESLQLRTKCEKAYNMVKDIKEGLVLMYCSYRRDVDTAYKILYNMMGSVTEYHAGLDDEVRTANMLEFTSGGVGVCVATNAFGMGIDVSNIRAVIHLDPPGSLEDLSQQMGRAGRDGKDSICHMFYSLDGMRKQEHLFELSNPTGRTVVSLYNELTRIWSTNGEKPIIASMESIGERIGLNEGEANSTFNFLVSMGVIKREAVTDRTYTVTILDPDWKNSGMSKVRIALLDLVVKSGVEEEDLRTASGARTYSKVDTAYLASCRGVTEGSIRNNLNQLKRDGFINLTAPPRCKATILLRKLTQEDIDTVNRRRAFEYEKLDLIKGYHATPDSQKADYIDAYFTREM